MRKTVLIAAGEASADRHASAVIRAVRALVPEAAFVGLGGPEMKSAGMDAVYSMEEISIMGFTEVASRIFGILRVYRGMKRLIRELRPDLFIAVDLPDFNMRLASYAKSLGVKVLYYIAPQAWAWRRSRAATLARITDGLAVIFPFEEGFFKAHGVNARYVGHPMLEPGSGEVPEASQTRWPPESICMMPGSRAQEIRMILPVMTQAKRLVSRGFPGIRWQLRLAPGLDRAFVERFTDADVLVEAGARPADLAIVKSGTSSLEMAVSGVPEIVCYRTSTVNYILARLMVRIDHIGMPNIIAGRSIVPELVQGGLTAEALAEAVTGFVTNRSLYEATREALLEIRGRLGSLRASREVARWAVQLMEGA